MIQVFDVVLPNVPLSNIELADAAKKLKIPHFKGVFVRDELPSSAAKNECGILNLDDSSGNGTHWVAWFKRGDNKFYFDSFGLNPPEELVKYLKSPVYYNSERIQPDGQVFCGHLCLYMSTELSNSRGEINKTYQSIINNLH